MKRVWCCPLASPCVENIRNFKDGAPVDTPFVANCYDKSFTNTRCAQQQNCDPCGGPGYNSAAYYTNLIKLKVNTPAVYLGGNLDKHSDFDTSQVTTERLVLAQGRDACDSTWPRPICEYPGGGTGSAGISPCGSSGFNNVNRGPGVKCWDWNYALMFSKCRDDPVIDPKTTYPRRCCDLYCKYMIPDVVRPICGLDWAPNKPEPVCKNITPCKDILNTQCPPAGCYPQTTGCTNAGPTQCCFTNDYSRPCQLAVTSQCPTRFVSENCFNPVINQSSYINCIDCCQPISCEKCDICTPKSGNCQPAW